MSTEEMLMSRHNASASHMRGVTLLELMIVVVIVGILASIAIPSYRSYVLRSQRSDATSSLLRLASAQEKYYLRANTYTNNLALLNMTSASENGWYTLAVPTADARTFTATATAPTSSSQYADAACREFSITATGQRDAKKSDDSANPTECWR
jgi:type IV pilus assembly protein PilE